MKKTLIFHIGTHKTGTTSFQAWLAENRNLLRGHNISVRFEDRDDGSVDANNVNFANIMLRRGLETGHRIRNNIGAPPAIRRFRGIVRFRECLNKVDCHTLIVSAEGLCFARRPSELFLLKLCVAFTGWDVRVLLVRRSRKDWERSWRNQLLKDERIRAHFELFDYPQRIDKSWYFEFERIERFWSALGEVKVIDYDMSIREDGSIIPTILHEIGLSRDFSSNIFLNRSVDFH